MSIIDWGYDFECNESRGTLFFDTRRFGPKGAFFSCTKNKSTSSIDLFFVQLKKAPIMLKIISSIYNEWMLCTYVCLTC